MNTMFHKVVLLVLVLVLGGCTTDGKSIFSSSSKAEQAVTNKEESAVPSKESETPTVAMGGSVRKSMDSVDLSKLSRAMDKAPGKSTTWVNGATGIKYTVTPIRVVTVNDNHFCRTYSLTAERNNSKRATSGTACVGTDSSWHDV
jgi:surface antigen